ncbi:hypothetical protein B0H17DRAFT_1206544 [Mycena rosella]|uniref:Uncharacterized protein n=1 Tax=Mycena rosella TaxID=1033263 RepID=A0AAD7D4R6_MYCRO|nr:hypothetical protein B0H17DRAFT_1206544 [Mycena rosella]
MGNGDGVYQTVPRKPCLARSECELGVRAVYASTPWCSGDAEMRVRAAREMVGARLRWLALRGFGRWGDTPGHSIAAGLFASKDQIQFFEEIGYEPYTHCPKDPGIWERGKCECDPQRSFDYDGYSCMRQ